MMTNFRTILLFVLASLMIQSVNGQSGTLSADSQISLLTCEPGHFIHSTFGHSALRIKGQIDGHDIDSVYNFGTFEFTDDFALKFARGKLNYMLSKDHYGQFLNMYHYEKRGVREQILDLDSTQAQELYQLLEINHLPENRFYLYDFFYDNCSTRIRDVLKAACGEDLKFKNLNDGKTTYRQRIQEYLDAQQWADLGIDLALGAQCDYILQGEEDMFLPDYLYDNFESAQLNGKSLVSERFVVLDMPFEPGPKSVVPNLIFWGQFVIVCIIVFLYFRSRQKPYRTLHVLYVIAGLLSIALLLLWFATDHTTTADNLNLLWANPICVLLLFFSREGRLRKVLEMVYLAVLFVVLVAWNKLGQEFHPLVLPLVLSLFVTLGAVVLMKPSRK